MGVGWVCNTTVSVLLYKPRTPGKKQVSAMDQKIQLEEKEEKNRKEKE